MGSPLSDSYGSPAAFDTTSPLSFRPKEPGAHFRWRRDFSARRLDLEAVYSRRSGFQKKGGECSRGARFFLPPSFAVTSLMPRPPASSPASLPDSPPPVPPR